MRIRWYNPVLGDFEWRVAPETDEDAPGPDGGIDGASSLHRRLPRVDKTRGDRRRVPCPRG